MPPNVTMETLAPSMKLITPAELLSDTLWVTFPELGDKGSAETRFSPHGSVIKDSMMVAAELGAGIVVAERPGMETMSAISLSMRRKLRDNYSEVAKRHGEKIARAVKPLGNSVIKLYADSAAGTHALAVAASESLDVAAVGTFDPVGWFTIKQLRGYAEFARYTFKDEKAFMENHNDPELPDWYQPNAFKRQLGTVQMIGRQIRDIIVTGPMWGSDTTYRTLENIRDNQPDVAVLVVIPEASLGMSSNLISKADTIQHLRAGVDPYRQAEFKIMEQLGWSHASLNNRMPNRLQVFRGTDALGTAS